MMIKTLSLSYLGVSMEEDDLDVIELDTDEVPLDPSVRDFILHQADDTRGLVSTYAYPSIEGETEDFEAFTEELKTKKNQLEAFIRKQLE